MMQTGVMDAAGRLEGRLPLLVLLALVCLLLGYWTEDMRLRLALSVAGMSFVMLTLLSRLAVAWSLWRGRALDAALLRLTGADPIPCFTTDAQGRIGFRNPAAAERFGSGSGEMLVMALRDHFVSPAAVLYRLQGRARGSGAAREDLVTRRGHLRVSVILLRPGVFLWRVEEFLDRATQGRGVEGMSLPMLVANKAGVVLFSNDAMRRLLGGRPKRLDRIFASSVLRTGEEVEVAAAHGPVRALVGEVGGAGERREIFLLPVPAEAAARPNPADFQNLPVPLMKLAPDGTLRDANLAARDLLGPGDLPPSFPNLFEGLGRSVTDWLADVVDERIPGGSEVLRLRRAGTDVFFQITLRRLVEEGRPGLLVVLSDATAMKTLEAQFVQSQKMQAIGQLAGGVAHDFNNLLTAISGHCDLLLLRRDPADSDYPDLMQIHQNANRAAGLVGQLLAFSRKQTLKPERIDLQDVLSDLTHLLNRLVGETVRLDLGHAPGLHPIRADRRQLEQVVMNLVVNARDAMPGGGVISIATEALSLADDLHRDRALVPRGDYAVIHVRDTGSGIPADRLQKIFEPFFTTKRPGEGTGLGLSTVYGIVKQSGGFVFVDSVPGEGSAFHVYFPAHPGLPGEAPAHRCPARPLPAPRGGVVLLVEDEAPVRAFAARALRMRGHTVLEAASAEDALTALADPALEVDVFVTDVVMPGMDGPSWVRLALADRPDVRVIFVSGYAEEGFADGQARIPNSVFLAKPFSLNDLAGLVQEQRVSSSELAAAG